MFSKAGYRVALIARNADSLNKFARELNSQDGEVRRFLLHHLNVISDLLIVFKAAAFTIPQYGYKDIHNAFDAIKKHWPDSEIRVALWNAGYGVWKPFLDVKEEELAESLQTNVTGAFSFSREAVLAFKQLSLNDAGKRGTLVITGATASIRGNTTVSTPTFRPNLNSKPTRRLTPLT